MARNFTKTVDEDLPFAIDWGTLLANEADGAGDTIATSDWVITPSGLTNGGAVVDSADTRTVIQVSGGTSGTTYKLTNTITLTTGGYTLVEYITIRVV